MKCVVYNWCIFYEKSSVATELSHKQKHLGVSNPRINMVNEEKSTMVTLGADVSLKKRLQTFEDSSTSHNKNGNDGKVKIASD